MEIALCGMGIYYCFGNILDVFSQLFNFPYDFDRLSQRFDVGE